jgi:hypothetical protein
MPTLFVIQSSETAKASAASAASEASREEIDWEERRWQLEWARRNVED